MSADPTGKQRCDKCNHGISLSPRIGARVVCRLTGGRMRADCRCSMWTPLTMETIDTDNDRRMGAAMQSKDQANDQFKQQVLAVVYRAAQESELTLRQMVQALHEVAEHVMFLEQKNPDPDEGRQAGESG